MANDVMEHVKDSWNALAELSEITTTTEQSELLERAIAGLAFAHDALKAKEPEEEESQVDPVDRALNAISMLRFAEAAIIEGASEGLGFLMDNCLATLEEYISHSEQSE